MSATCTFVEHHLQLYCDDLISGRFSIWGRTGKKKQFITKIDKYSGIMGNYCKGLGN